MNGFWTLLLLSTIMGGTSFLAGLLPLSFSLSPRQLRFMTALGTGVLVGTSLVVIIPEGVETLYKASGNSHSHDERSLPIAIAQRSVFQTDIVPAVQLHEYWKRGAIPDDSNHHGDGLRSGPDDGFSKDSSELHSTHAGDDDSHDSSHAGLGAAADREPHAWIGVSLICGFILMYLIDTIPRQASVRSQPRSFPISLNQFSFNNPGSPIGASPEAADDTTETVPDSKTARPSSTTTGLVIHAAADGIALGASSTTSSNLSLVIFFALLLHKAPAAFGLSSVLLKLGVSTRVARTHLIIFSLAAPVGAMCTWAAINLLGLGLSPGDSSGNANADFAIGCVLLFSGGYDTEGQKAHSTQPLESSTHASQATAGPSVPFRKSPRPR